jgi:hypothetical protein
MFIILLPTFIEGFAVEFALGIATALALALEMKARFS